MGVQAAKNSKKSAKNAALGKGSKGTKGTKGTKLIKINCAQPVEEKVFDASALVTFLQQKIKIDGRTGNLGESITVKLAEGSVIELVSKVEISRRYVKYLTKKHLKKQQLRDWLRVVATDKQTYSLKFFNVAPEADAEEEDDE